MSGVNDLRRKKKTGVDWLDEGMVDMKIEDRT